MKKIEMTFSEIEEIIDNLENDESVCFVCDFDLAEEITDYISEVYSVDDEYINLSEDNDEYYVSIVKCKSEIAVICENLRSEKTGEVKYSDIGKGDYYIFLDINRKIAREKFESIGGHNWCEYMVEFEDDDFDVDEDGDSEDFEDCTKFKKEFLSEVLDNILAAKTRDAQICELCSFLESIEYTSEIHGHVAGLKNVRNLMDEIIDHLETEHLE